VLKTKPPLVAVLIWVLLAPCANPAPAQDQTRPKLTLREQLVGIPTGSAVEVRTRDKQKIRGRLGEVGNEGFLVQIIRNDKLETLTVALDNTKSVKLLESLEGAKPSHVAGKVVVGVLAGAGLIILILACVAGATS
jgi:hypothetical protein